jgi:CRP-like cAMP-binding protein
MLNIFNKINEVNKRKLLKCLEADIFTYQENVDISFLIKESNNIGIVLNGYIQIIKIEYDGTRRIIENLEEGSIFGQEMSFMHYGDYEIITKETSKIIIIDFNFLYNSSLNKYSFYNQFITNLIEILNNKINEKNQRIEILVQKTIRNKLLEYFKLESIKNNSKIIYIPNTFIDLADYLAIDRSAMTRELKNLKNEGFIEIKNKRITLLY